MRGASLACVLLCTTSALDIRVDDRTVIYNGGANYTASLEFCEQHNIPHADACAWDIYQTSGATSGQLIQEAWALLPDAYVDVKQARDTVSELQRASLINTVVVILACPSCGRTGGWPSPAARARRSSFYEAGAASIRSFVPCARELAYVAADLE